MPCILHPEDHREACQRVVLERLIERAVAGEIALLCEGVDNTDPGERRIRTHGLDWSGSCERINGLEAPASPALDWATAARYATASPEDMQVSGAGQTGAETIRFVCVALAWLAEAPLDPPLVSLKPFIDALRADLRPGDRAATRLEAANRLAVQAGRWPGGELTFGQLTEGLRRTMPALGLGGEELQTAMDRVLYTEREAGFARCIAASAAATDLEVHVVLGVGHAAGLVDDRFLRAIGVDVVPFRLHQAGIPGPRLWDLVACTADTRR